MTVGDLDVAAVRRGALGVVMFVAPVLALSIALAGGDKSSPAWLLSALALLFGSAFGGFVAAYQRPPTPMAHGAAAAATGLAACLTLGLLVQLAQGELSVAAAFTAFVFLQIGTALGCLGGLLAAKGVRRAARS